jgi:rhodanese-related sulfurtransferase
MRLSVAQLVAEAKAKIQNLSPDQVANELQAGTSTLIDIREPPELAQTGIIPGALHAPRGMLEFYADPSSPSYRDAFDPDARLILACDSGARSALAVETLQRMGYRDVAHLDGGMNAWIAQGLPVEPAP